MTSSLVTFIFFYFGKLFLGEIRNCWRALWWHFFSYLQLWCTDS